MTDVIKMHVWEVIQIGGVTPTGKITITENGTGIDVAQYASADVAVPEPTGTITITTNGTTDVTQYATAVTSVLPSAAELDAYVNNTVLGGAD